MRTRGNSTVGLERRANEHRGVERWVAGLMGFEAATFAVMSALHLSGVLAGGSEPYDPTDAGVAEAIICLALVTGAVALLRESARAKSVAIATTGFAIVGVLVGLNFTIQGAGPIDIAYHATVLPPLLLTLVALVRPSQPSST